VLTPGSSPHGRAVPPAAALYLAGVQFFLATTWTVYVIFLPSLAESVGIRSDLIIWVLMLDQLVFAVMDTATGMAADQVGRILGRLGPFIVAGTIASCLAFLALPHAALGAGAAGGSTLFFGLTLVWTTTSSLLRAPAWVMIARYAAGPALPWFSALSLVGVSVGAAVAPYLGLALRNTNPRLPFAVSSLTLLVTAVGLIWVERALATADGPTTPAAGPAAPAPAGPTTGGPWLGPQTRPALVAAFLLAAGVLALGYQTHIFFNAAAEYLRFVPAGQLELLSPIFWIGFNLLSLPAAYLTPRLGGFPVMIVAAVTGAVGTAIAALAPNLPLTVLGQLVAGGAWGVLLMAGLAAALSLGRTGREGLTLGLWFSAQAVATLLRMSVVAAQLTAAPGFILVAPWAPPALWLGGGLVLLALLARHSDARQVLLADQKLPSPTA
jgi:predicted MFS family arabinose efflux permease